MNPLEQLKKLIEKKDHFWDDFDDKLKFKRQRYKHVKKYLKNVDFNKLILRLILEHNEKYIEKCIQKSIEPPLTNKMELLFDWLFIPENKESYKVEPVSKKDYHINATMFKHYTFEIIHGQGCLFRIYNSNHELIFNW